MKRIFWTLITATSLLSLPSFAQTNFQKSLVVTLAGDTLRCVGPARDEATYDMPACYLDSYAAAIAHFVDCLESGAAFETSPADNLATLELVEATYAAANAQ